MTVTVTGISRSGEISALRAALADEGLPPEPLQLVAPVKGAQALVAERLRELHIPGDELQNYVDAVEAGRTVVAYIADPDAAERIVEVFRESGLVKVRVQRARAASRPASVPGHR